MKLSRRTSAPALSTATATALLLIATASTSHANDREALVGTWRITVFQDDGRDRLDRLGAGEAKKGKPARVAKMVFTAEECWILRGDGKRELVAGLANAGWKSVTLDPTTTPKSIDIVGFAAKDSDATKTYKGIYELNGKTLRICYGEGGKTRPTKLESDGENNLFVCERLSDDPEQPAE